MPKIIMSESFMKIKWLIFALSLSQNLYYKKKERNNPKNNRKVFRWRWKTLIISIKLIPTFIIRQILIKRNWVIKVCPKLSFRDWINQQPVFHQQLSLQVRDIYIINHLFNILERDYISRFIHQDYISNLHLAQVM